VRRIARRAQGPQLQIAMSVVRDVGCRAQLTHDTLLPRGDGPALQKVLHYQDIRDDALVITCHSPVSVECIVIRDLRTER
jgi:hypothetical protein